MALITTGDRIADFTRPTRSGQLITLYKDYCASTITLVVMPGKADPAAQRQLLTQLTDQTRTSSEHTLLIVDKRSSDQDWPLNPDQIIVDDGQYMAYLCHEQGLKTPGSAGISASALVLVTDRNMHVIERGIYSVNQTGDIESDIRRVQSPVAGQAAADPLSGQNQAPVLIVPNVLDETMCKELIELYQTDNEASGILTQSGDDLTYAPDSSVKIRREHRLQSGKLMSRLEATIARRVLPEIRWFSWFDVTRYEGMKIVAYDAGEEGYFRVHRDNDGSDTQHRRFAMTVNLNTTDYTGGGLSFPEYSQQRYAPEPGTAVLFSCNLAHQVDPVSQGVRYALVSFFYGDQQQITTPVPGQ